MTLEIKKFTSFAEFWEEVYKENGEFEYLNQERFIFRGEGCDNYSLIPSSLRRDKSGNKLISKYTSYAEVEDEDNNELWQRMAECELLNNFYWDAQNNGLKVPDIPLFRDSALSHCSSIEDWDNDVLTNEIRYGKKWLPDDLKELAALAQHYGIPTRLLDWTFNIDVALYFATINAIKDIMANKYSNYFVIWALDYKYSNFYNNLELIEPMYSANPNLQAQKGVLLTWEEDKNKGLLPLDKVFDKKDKNELGYGLIKFELPIGEAYRAYKYVKSNGYTTASLFPGYEGAAKYSLEQAKIKDSDCFLNK